MLREKQSLLSICELIVDCEHKTAPTQETGYPSIRTPNIGRGRLILDGVNRVSEETYREWSKRAVPQAEDLILAREAPIGNVTIIPKNLRVCLGQRTVLIRPNKNKVCPMFLVYFMLGDEIQAKLLGRSTGATVSHLNMRDIRNLAFPKLPPLPTQRKIASILSAYDDLIENNTRRIKILEDMTSTIYRQWSVEFRFPGHENVPMVESELGLIPRKWEILKFSDIVELLRKGVVPSKFPEEIFAHFSIPAFDNGCMPSFDSGDIIRSNKYLVTENCVLVSKLNPHIPRVWLPFLNTIHRAIASTEFLILKPKPPVDCVYLFNFCRSTDFSGKFAVRH